MGIRRLGETLPRLVDRMVASYMADPRTQHLDREYLPDPRRVVEICDVLLELTYPGYFGRRELTRHNISYHVGELLARLWDVLHVQVTHCLRHAAEAGGSAHAESVADCEDAAADLATRFLERIPGVRDLLADDVQAAYDGDPAATDTAEVILSYPGIQAITLYRYAHELYRLNVPRLPRMMGEHAHQLTGIDIHPGARIGRRFFIDHGTGVVIGETAMIGDNVRMYQGVTLGSLSFKTDERGRLIRGLRRHPTVGNNVTLYANAIVLGGNTVIGDGAVVGGSVFLIESVQPGYQVSISPPVLKLRPPKPAGGEDYVPMWHI